MTSFTPADTLHRLVKEALDSGAVTSLAEANAMFRSFRVGFSIAEPEASDPHYQAALLTGIALARRVFLGGVRVSGRLCTPLSAPLPLGATLGEAVERLGGVLGEENTSEPLINIGGPPRPRSSGFHVRTACAGWRGGILPVHAEMVPVAAPVMPLASMLSAALAVNEAFLFTRGHNPAFGMRPVGLSLWRPSAEVHWLASADDEPELTYLPSRLWVIGLGHLGQAYLWGLGLLPYPDPSAVSLVLQDVDIITPSTESTSILTDANLVGQKKTRAMAAWAERRGFSTVIHERLFDIDFHRQPHEPAIALCGLDNALGRRALDKVGFDLVIEAGLGRGYQDFRTMRLHTLPGPRSADALWKNPELEERVELGAGYQRILTDGELDRCGVTLLAGKSVGAPFVGAIAASLALSELLRLLHGGTVHQIIDLDLQGIEYRSTVPHPYDFSRLNPGYVRADSARVVSPALASDLWPLAAQPLPSTRQQSTADSTFR
jgi:hypothetical protein